jgi:hypothetical protein
MVKPQQPELRRSDRGATSDDATKGYLTAPATPGVDGAAGGPVPVDNLPGHHPDHEQDKPSGKDFVAKMHALAQAEAIGEETEDAEGRTVVPPQSRDDEVFDLADIEADHVHGPGQLTGAASHVADTLASLAGKPFAIAGSVLGAVRNRLPGS